MIVHTLRRTCPLAALVVVAAGGLGGVLALGLAVRLLTRGRIVPPDRLPPLPVALVLGAEVYADGRPSRFLRARLDVAADLYRRSLVGRILLSGDGQSPFYDETAGMRDYLLAVGVPAGHIVLDPSGFDTYDSCLRARDVFGLRRLVVVSQAYHLPRALAICRALGLDAWGVGDDSVRRNVTAWRASVGRELAANLKLVWDVATRRPPRAHTH
ncbi:MAG: YdcF family protein [Actinobacteria bacterium]|nr:YdcF family protein [Actinomycetota bacterium]